MKSIIFKIIIVFFILTIILLPKNIFAISNVFNGGDDFINGANANTIDETNLDTVSEIIYNTLLALGIVTAVIIASILGIKFMTGGISEQAKVKESLIPFVAGCAVIFGAFGIWKIIVTVGQGL